MTNAFVTLRLDAATTVRFDVARLEVHFNLTPDESISVMVGLDDLEALLAQTTITLRAAMPTAVPPRLSLVPQTERGPDAD